LQFHAAEEQFHHSLVQEVIFVGVTADNYAD